MPILPTLPSGQQPLRARDRVWLLAHTVEFDVRQLTAEVVFHTADGIRTPSFTTRERNTHLTDLQVRCYLDAVTGRVYGCRAVYRTTEVDRGQAAVIASVLDRVDRAVAAAAAQRDTGWTFADYLTVVGAEVKVSGILLPTGDGPSEPGRRTSRRPAGAEDVLAWEQRILAGLTTAVN
jgi:hypothetical protein